MELNYPIGVQEHIPVSRLAATAPIEGWEVMPDMESTATCETKFQFKIK